MPPPDIPRLSRPAHFEEEPTRPLRRERLFWYLQATGWAGTLFVALVASRFDYYPKLDLLYVGVFRVCFGLLVTCLLRYGYRWLRRQAWRFPTKVAGVFLVSGGVAVLDSGATFLFVRTLALALELSALTEFLLVSFLMRWLLYLLWSNLYFGLTYWLDTEDSRVRLARAEAAARSSELQLLRAQVNPHFLFNALNSILAESANPRTVNALTQALAEYLRFSFHLRGDAEPLGVELEAMENFLQVEKVRFEENLEYEINAGAQVRARVVPIALVQPLLDNALKYGGRSTVRPLRVRIAAWEAGGRVELRVTNTGEWVPPGEGGSTGTGLANLQRRLELIYGPEATLTTQALPSQVEVRLSLPGQLPVG